MKFKIKGVALVIIAVLLGCYVYNLQSPNQKITIDFNQSAAQNNAEQTVASIEAILKSHGIDNIIVSKSKAGQLTISYFSKENINAIKTALHHRLKIPFSTPTNSSDDQPKTAQLQIELSHITKPLDSFMGLGKTVLVQAYTKSDTHLKYPTAHAIVWDVEGINGLVFEIVNAQPDIASLSQKLCFLSIKVRAGPLETSLC